MEYKTRIIANDQSDAAIDIPLATCYQNLLKTNDGTELITLLLHADGVSVTRFTKLKMWLLSACIIELPPKLRSGSAMFSQKLIYGLANASID